MFRYFGFGSNMSMTSLQAKGVEPLTSQRAILHGWRLRFNVQHFFRHEGGVGNIEYTGKADDVVIGVLHDCHDEALPHLDAAEAYGHGYDRITVDVETDNHDIKNPQAIPALTYIGMPEFIDNHCLPSQRYLNIVTEGARRAGIEQTYIEALVTQPVHITEDFPTFTPPVGKYPTFNAAELAQYPMYTALFNAVFDMSEARPLHEFLKDFFGGKDMTLFHLKRLDSSNNESMEDIRLGRLNDAQQRYLNGYLNEYAREYRYVGHFDYHKE